MVNYLHTQNERGWELRDYFLFWKVYFQRAMLVLGRVMQQISKNSAAWKLKQFDLIDWKKPVLQHPFSQFVAPPVAKCHKVIDTATTRH